MTPTRLRIVLFGTEGLLTAGVFRAARRHDLVAVVQPARARRADPPPLRRFVRPLVRLVRGRRGRTTAELAATRRIPRLEAGRRDPALAERLRALDADLFCLAGYPWLLPAELLAIPRLGAINLHTALLPRHRGVLPLFWIYYHDDRETGLTVHWVDAGADTGDVICQHRFPLPRGFSVDRLHQLNSAHGGDLMARALDLIAKGDPPRHPQDHARATLAPWVKPGVPMIDFEAWDVERVWHFLAGLCPRFREPLHEPGGQPLGYSRVLGFDTTVHGREPGQVASSGRQHTLYCRGGVVRLAAE